MLAPEALGLVPGVPWIDRPCDLRVPSIPDANLGRSS